VQLRSLLSWDVVEHRLVVTDISGQHIALIFKVCMTLADGTNISNKLPTYTTQHPRTLKHLMIHFALTQFGIKWSDVQDTL